MDDLTERARQILELIGSGFGNKENATKLFLAEKTVKHYMTNILQKLEAALIAQEAEYR